MKIYKNELFRGWLPGPEWLQRLFECSPELFPDPSCTPNPGSTVPRYPTAESVEASLADTGAIEFHSFQFKGQLAHMHSGLTGHDRWEVLEGHNCFTMLREPVDQAISLYYYLLRRRMYVEPVYLARGIRFPESFEEYIDGVYHFNLQTAFFANKHQLNEDSAVNQEDLSPPHPFIHLRRVVSRGR